MGALRPLLLLLVLGTALLRADTVTLKNGKKLEGKVIAEGGEVLVHTFNSGLAQATFGLERVPSDRVKKIVRTLPAPHQEFQLRLKRADSAEALVELATWCEAEKLKEERLVALERALQLDPENAAARAALGSRAGRTPWADQLALARRFVDGAEDRAALLAEAKRDPSFPWSERELWRAARSKQQPKGYQLNRAVAMRSDQLLPNARYTLFVPDAYDPLRPTPLVIGLHGGGAGGADGKLVVGSGDQAMNFYQGDCDKRGWICACPTALRAGWGARENDDLLDALLDELRALYNIDEHRIYLVGHSMGGGGTWAQGTRIPEVFAAIAPAASFGVQGIDRLTKTRTGFYVYHSDDDSRCPCPPVRSAMMALPGSDADFVYSEIPGQDHAFPREVVEDIFAFFDARLLATGPGRFRPQVRPLPSFARKESRDEKKYLPPLVPDDEEEGAALSPLLKELRMGGGVGEGAVAKLAAHADPKTSAAVAKVLLRPNTPPDVRRYAVRTLGERKAADQLDAIGRILLIDNEAELALEALRAIEKIADPAAGAALLRFLRKRGDYFAERRQGHQLDHSDWATILPPLSLACSLLGSYRTPKAAASIAAVALDEILLSDTTVVYDTKNQNPLPPAQGLAASACGALALLGDPAALPALQKMASAGGEGTGAVHRRIQGEVGEVGAWPKDPAIRGHVREALDALSSR